jgi:hypothetical protein
MRSAIHALFVGLPIVLGLSVEHANADVLSQLQGIVCDPLKLGSASEHILESVERMDALIAKVGQVEGKTNTDLKERISQVQQIVDRVIAAVNDNVATLDADVKDAELKIDGLESKVYADASDLMFQATCVLEQAGSDQIPRALAQVISNIKKADPHASILGIRVASLSVNPIQIKEPDKTYISIRDAYINDLPLLVDNDAAYAIVSAYANIIRAARFASCSYQHQPLFLYFLREQFEYARLMAPWESVSPKMQ